MGFTDGMSDRETENVKAAMMFGLLFGCNILGGKLVNTGAFEMTYRGETVWSKLESGRFPTLPELIDAVAAVAKTAGAATSAAARSAEQSAEDADDTW